MSLKAVELQVALPRTQDIIRIQEQQQQRNMHEQQLLIEDRKQLDETNRQRAADIDSTERNQIRERERQKRQNGKNLAPSLDHVEGGAEPVAVPAASVMRDPLRGRHIDISL
jgi:hypothetical protein